MKNINNASYCIGLYTILMIFTLSCKTLHFTNSVKPYPSSELLAMALTLSLWKYFDKFSAFEMRLVLLCRHLIYNCHDLYRNCEYKK